MNTNEKQLTTKDGSLEKCEEKPEAGKFRTILPQVHIIIYSILFYLLIHSNDVFVFISSSIGQVLASTAKNFLLLDLGLSVAFPTIVIPALMGLNNENNPNEMVQLTAVQASWLGMIFKII